jgi:ferric-dicitrate binding protein FerR (iron transport regulator)
MQDPHYHHLITARAALADRRLAHARAVLRKVIQDDPRHAEAWALLSQALDAGPEQAAAEQRAIALGGLTPRIQAPPPRRRRIALLIAAALAGLGLCLLLSIWLATRPPPALVIHSSLRQAAGLRMAVIPHPAAAQRSS